MNRFMLAIRILFAVLFFMVAVILVFSDVFAGGAILKPTIADIGIFFLVLVLLIRK